MRLDPRVPIAVATKNADKFGELVMLWGDTLPVLVPPGDEYPDVEEPHATYEENALLKATELARLRGGPALADDSGIEVDALGWAPGVVSARTPSPDSTPGERNADILGRLAALGDVSRRARYVCVCALVVPGQEPLIGRGEVEGEIARESRGPNGFGYDPIFYYPPYGRTFGEVGIAMKHAVSHRARAIRALLDKVRNLKSSS
jgi:XTP/dITP diphosphohydrolase